MLYFIKINEDCGTWANRDKALEYLSQGYSVYADNETWRLCTEEEIQNDVESSRRDVTERFVLVGKARGRIELPMPLSEEDKKMLGLEGTTDVGN